MLAGGLASLGAWALAHRLLHQKAQVLFKAEVDREEESLTGRLDRTLEVLRAAQSLFDLVDEVSPAQWEAFGQRFGVQRRGDGLRSIGYIAIVPPAEAEAFVARQRRTRPEFRIHDHGPGPDRAPLTLMYPWSPDTRGLLGYDIYSLDVRRATILQAIQTGSVTVTEAMHPAAARTGPQEHPGAVFHAPVYRPGRDLSTPAARKAAIRGVVFSSYYVDELLASTLRVHPALRVMVTDGPGDNLERKLFESRPDPKNAHFHYDATHTVGGRTWSIHYEAPRTFAVEDDLHAPRYVLGAGIALTLVLAAFTHSLALRRLKEERLLAELTESEARFRALAETTDSAILLYWDTVSYANPGAASILGRAREALIGMPPLELIHPEDRALAAETLEARKAGELRPRRWEFRVLRPDGSFRWVDLTATTVSFQGKRLVLATALDITDRIESERARTEFAQKLFEARRMQSLGLIAGGLSHDFNNLVTAIQGNVSCAELELPDEAPARAFLARIRESCARATDLTHAMLAYAGDAHFRWQRLDLNALVQEVVARTAHELGAGQDLETDLEATLPPLEGDPDQLTHALGELLENAFESLPAEGTVRVSTGQGPVDLAALDYDFFNPDSTVGACLWLSVSDNGPGMDFDTQRRMFDPFFSTKFAGRGLGLASVHGIMRSHHGGIRVLSRPGAGTTIVLFFPVLGREAASI
jgi:PAS domain S-box-containing protein